MSYATREEVRQMIRDSAFAPIVDDAFRELAEDREAALDPLIDMAIQDADAEIDGYLAKRYTVPVSPAPRVLNKLSKDIALYNLFSRMGINEDSREKVIITRYNSAIKFLTLVAEGTVSLGTESEDPASAAATGFTVSSNGRIFSRRQMEGM